MSYTLPDTPAPSVALTTRTREWADAHLDSVRLLGEWADRRPDVGLSFTPGDKTAYVFCGTPEAFTEASRALMDGAPIGEVRKHDSETYLMTSRIFGSITVQVTGRHEEVCERVQTGTEIVTRPNPAAVAALPTETVEVPVYGWRCPPVLGGAA